MPKNADSLNRSLFELLQSKGYDPTLLSTSGKETPTPEEAEVFQFNFVKDGEDYGKVTMSIDGLHKLIIYYDDEIANSEKETDESGDLSWYQLLNQLKKFAQKYQLSFELRNVSNLKHDMAKREYMKKKESIAEGYYPMGKKASYSDAVPSVKIVLQHTRQIEEGEQRYRNVAKIFLENESGERFLAPTTKPGIARVYARHIAEGGVPNDERWNHIKSLCEEYQKMAGFVRATRNGQFNESTQKLVAEGINHYQKLRESLGKLAGHRGYNMYFESWTPPLMEDETDTSSLNELFVQETVDPRIESVMPILARLSKNITEMSEVSELAEWADNLLEDDTDIEDNEAADAADNEEQDLTEAPGAETLKHNQSTEKQNLKAFGLAEDEAEQELAVDELDEGRLDGDSDIDSPVADAITRRILMRRTDLLAKYGPEKVSEAIADVAEYVGDFIGPDDEIGSSDISGWVKQVEELLSDPLEEGERPGLWANIHAKRERIKHGSGERMRKPGSKGAPTAQAFKDAAKEGIEEGIADDYEHMSDNELMRHASMLGMEENIVPDDEGGLANRREIIYLLQQAADGDLDEGILDTLKKGAKAVGKAIVGPDDDELLRDLKKKAGVRNPETGKPSMAHSDVEKVDEDGQFAGDYKTGPEGQWRNKGPKANKPAKVGDLVGASESAEPKKEMLEGQEDLDAILRIIKK